MPKLEMTVDQELDATGLNCPLPLLKTKVLLNDLNSGQVLRVKATDRGSLADIPAFCAKVGHPLLAVEELENCYVFVVQKK